VTPAASAESAGYSVDLFLGGRVTLLQPQGGHRAGLDAALLQALVPAMAAGHAVDLGTGAGTVALCLAARCPVLQVTGVERDAGLVAAAEMAREHPANAGFAGRLRFVQGDATARRAGREAMALPDGSADWVLMNPPFDAPGTVTASPDQARRAAHLADEGGLAAWTRTASALLNPGGRLAVIHRAAALPDLLAALAGRFGAAIVLPVHPSEGKPASRVLVRATRGSRGPLQLIRGLVLHGADGAWTAAADAILHGRAEIALGESGS